MKKLCALLLAALLMTALCTACSSGEEADTASASAAEQDASTVDYASWTKSDWDKATEEQKTGAARYMLFQIGESIMPDFSTLVQEAETDDSVQAQIENSVKNIRDQIGTYFDDADSGATLGDLIEAAGTVVS